MAEMSKDVGGARYPRVHGEPSGQVYFVRNEMTGNIKIGFTTNLTQRIATLQAMTDCELGLIPHAPASRERARDARDKRVSLDLRARRRGAFPTRRGDVKF